MPRIACSTLHLTHRPLVDALEHVARLGFTAWELPMRGDGVWQGHVDPARLLDDPDHRAMVRAAAARFPELRCVGAGFEIAHDAPLARESAQFAAACALLRELGASGIGIFLFDGQPVASRERHAALRAIATAHGLELSVETHLGTATQDPARARGLAAELDLRLCVDFSHWVGQGIEPDAFGDLIPRAAHIQVRGCAAGAVEQGVDDEAQVAALARRVRACTPAGYAGWYAIEYIDRARDWDRSIARCREAIGRAATGRGEAARS
ncbi:MAG TPA: TIM barrel protein [Planctomycetota bacterium]|nr:TIM barrel protein [Planctomycetota bacterium]